MFGLGFDQCGSKSVVRDNLYLKPSALCPLFLCKNPSSLPPYTPTQCMCSSHVMKCTYRCQCCI